MGPDSPSRGSPCEISENAPNELGSSEISELSRVTRSGREISSPTSGARKLKPLP
jgi:hypothetical protein